MTARSSSCHFRSSRRHIEAPGFAAMLPAGGIETLDARARAFFRDRPDSLLLGALPFDHNDRDCLGQPLSGEVPSAPAPSRDKRRWRVTPEPSAETYRAMVARALAAMDQKGRGALDKIVLARSLLVETDAPVDRTALLARLGRDPGVTTFLLPLSPGRDRALVGATPELLLSKQGASIVSWPLAGSARRGRDAASDREAAAGLEASEKNRREHALVVEAILDTLAPYCTEFSGVAAPALRATISMWHLGTRIAGRLKDAEVSAAELVSRLHPTPAVCGSPREAARDLIGALEPRDRGFYAGAVGWIDAQGDGEWHVTLRCGEISGRDIRLYAGAGIVPGSDPDEEVRETSAKFLALLDALGIDEHGRVPTEEWV